jgi:hypothetical protein
MTSKDCFSNFTLFSYTWVKFLDKLLSIFPFQFFILIINRLSQKEFCAAIYIQENTSWKLEIRHLISTPIIDIIWELAFLWFNWQFLFFVKKFWQKSNLIKFFLLKEKFQDFSEIIFYWLNKFKILILRIRKINCFSIL